MVSALEKLSKELNDSEVSHEFDRAGKRIGIDVGDLELLNLHHLIGKHGFWDYPPEPRTDNKNEYAQGMLIALKNLADKLHTKPTNLKFTMVLAEKPFRLKITVKE